MLGFATFSVAGVGLVIPAAQAERRAIAEIKMKYPELDGLDDNQVVDVLHQAFYADLPRGEVAAVLGVKSPAPPSAEAFTTAVNRSFMLNVHNVLPELRKH